MTRLIDADAVYKILESREIRKVAIGNPLTDWGYGYTCGIECAESEIERAPTVNAVPVIRCKDCKHMGDVYLVRLPWLEQQEHRCRYWEHPTRSDEYCSRAERKEE